MRVLMALALASAVLIGGCNVPPEWTQEPQGGTVSLGMSASEVQRIRGAPYEKNVLTVAGGARQEQWVYMYWGYYGPEPSEFLYFEDGVLVATQY